MPEKASFNLKSEAAKRYAMAKAGLKHMVNRTKVIEEAKEVERAHEFLNLETRMQEEEKLLNKKEYTFDMKRIREIEERKEREMKRRNQYQAAELKKDMEINQRLRIIDHWNYKERFREIRRFIP